MWIIVLYLVLASCTELCSAGIAYSECAAAKWPTVEYILSVQRTIDRL